MPLTPKEIADDSLARAKEVLAYSQDYELPPGLEDDLVRSALVMGVGALDSYLHAAVLGSLAAWKPTTALARIEVPFGELCSLVDEILEGREADPNSRPWVTLKSALREKLLRRSFQSSSSVERAIQMCGTRNAWAKLATERSISQTSLKKRLDGIVHRRNRIVHEGDLERSERPRSVQLETIEPQRVARDLSWLERLINAIESVLAG